MKKIVVFASGSGSNAEKIIQYFSKTTIANVAAVVTNNPNAKVIERAKNNNVDCFVFSKNQLNDGEVLHFLNYLKPDLIVLAGFLLQFPETIIKEFPYKIINIHPALLPKYGGKGMYGMNVHQAVLQNREANTGITIHYVNENYDEGKIIFQKEVNIENCTTAECIAEKVHELEHHYFSGVIEKLITNS